MARIRNGTWPRLVQLLPAFFWPGVHTALFMGLSLVCNVLGSMSCSLCLQQPASSVPELMPCVVMSGEGIWLGIHSSLGRRHFTYPVQQGWDFADGGVQMAVYRRWSLCKGLITQKVLWSSRHSSPEDRTLGWQGGCYCSTVYPVVVCRWRHVWLHTSVETMTRLGRPVMLRGILSAMSFCLTQHQRFPTTAALLPMHMADG